MAKDTYYFSHDYNARNDSKIKRLLSNHGYLGYGLFWAIVEDLYNNANALPTDYESIAFDLRTTTELVISIINDFDLFCIETSEFGSASIERRLNERNEKSVKARESAFKRWNKVKENANALPTQSDSNAIKESKGKETKLNKSIVFTPPILEDVLSYFKDNGYSEISAQKAFRYYNDANWMDSKGNKVKNWKQKMQGVWFKDENKQIEKSITPKMVY